MVGIYCITNLINGKKYIGQSINIEHRWKEHKQNAFNPNREEYNKPLYQAIRKYGLDKFSFEIIEECPLEELNEKEIYWINFYQTFPLNTGKGYNLHPGGEGNYPKLTNEQVVEIIRLLKEHRLNYREIANRFNVCKDLIGGINNGYFYSQPDISYPIRSYGKGIKKKYIHGIPPSIYKKYPVPPYEELLKSFYELRSAAKVAEKYDISQVLLKKWCNKVGINPQHKNEYIEKYEIEFLGKEPKKKRPLLKVLQIDPEINNVVNEFNSFEDASIKTGLPKTTINNYCNKGKQYAGYIWKRSTEIGMKNFKK